MISPIGEGGQTPWRLTRDWQVVPAGQESYRVVLVAQEAREVLAKQEAREAFRADSGLSSGAGVDSGLVVMTVWSMEDLDAGLA